MAAIITTAVRISEATEIGEARRAALALAGEIGFDEADAGRAGLVATEAAANVMRHGNGGSVLLSTRPASGGAGLELLALDQGPGIDNLAQCMRDGYSTAGSAGTGLGAIGRLSSEYAIHSSAGKGTALLARIFRRGSPRPAPGGLRYGGVAVPVRGEQQCGDAWQLRPVAGGAEVIVADGLGHGPDAAVASQAAVRAFEQYPGLPHPELMERIHGALRGTRGAAVALVRLSFSEGSAKFVSVGNVAGAVLSDGKSRQMVSYPGTVGHQMHKVRELTYECPPGALVLLHSDGVVSHWTLDPYPGLTACDPSLIAGVMYRDFSRGRDDSTVVAVRGDAP